MPPGRVLRLVLSTGAPLLASGARTPEEEAPVRTSTAALAAVVTTMTPAAALAATGSGAIRPHLAGSASTLTQMRRAAEDIRVHRALVRRNLRLVREVASARGGHVPAGAAAPARRATSATLKRRHARLERTLKAAPAASQAGGAGGRLAAIRSCESGGDYAANTGNGFYGAYQFTA